MNDLLQVIDTKLLPWAREPERDRLVLMDTSTLKAERPEGVRITRKLPRGPREIVKTRRILGNQNAVTAKWPRDGLVEVDHPLIICCYDGRIDYWAGDIVAHSDEGYFLLLPPGLRHDAGKRPHYDFDAQKPGNRDFCDLFWIGRRGRIIRIWTCHCKGAMHQSGAGQQADFVNDAANSVLDLLIAEAMAGKTGWREICRDHLCALLSLLRRDLETGAILISSRLRLETAATPDGDPIAQAKTYIENHLREHLTIDKVSRAVGISRAQFTRRFRRETNMSFAQYLAECRIEQAKTLLSQADWNLKRISDIVGLGSASYFCQFFAKHVGTSPQEFRKQQKVQNQGERSKRTK